ncbi:MAG: 5'-methylthioadenosine/S-adenosylhomocysteine nucleosidase [Uliginosibacterium sp.]|nr:5'-methylthioadenosine/S-adenosylhomocysteine nucleosidase [Uliginosibacterium sp.]
MIGILAASEDELQPVLDAMLIHELGRKSRLVFHVGTVGGIAAVAAFSGVGKVNAAIAAQCMIDLFNPARLYVTGVAGALGGPYGIGDTVLVRRVAHHDLEPGVLTAYHPFMPSEWYELDRSTRTLHRPAASQKPRWSAGSSSSPRPTNCGSERLSGRSVWIWRAPLTRRCATPTTRRSRSSRP